MLEMDDRTIMVDSHFKGIPENTAAFLIPEDEGCMFIETNTTKAVPYLLSALDAQRLSPADIKYIIVTHIHLDHAGGAGALLKHCPNATILCHPAARRHLIDPSRLIKSALHVFGEKAMADDYGEIIPVPEDRVRAVEDNEELKVGHTHLRFLHVRGHARHHMVVFNVSTNAVYTGDAFGMFHKILQEGSSLFVYPTCSPPQFEPEEGIKALDRIVETGADTLWLTHYGMVDDVKGAYEQVKRGLETMMEIADDGQRSKLQGDALQQFLRGHVEKYFREEFAMRGLDYDSPAYSRHRQMVAIDVELNAQGIRYM